MNIVVVGAGVAGLSAAYDLLAAGNTVTIYEAGNHTGGLAAGFRDPAWDWPVEKFYHHLFTSDKHIINLVEELNISDKLFFPKPITSVLYDDQIVPFDSPLAWIKFPGFNLIDVARFGMISAYLRFSNPWKRLETVTADSWLRRWYGDKIYETVWRPLLIGKFGPHFKEANMAWMWARLHVRSQRLGYFVGGFQSFIDTLTKAVEERGGKILVNTPVKKIEPLGEGQLVLTAGDKNHNFDGCLVTTSPSLLTKMAPNLSSDYLSELNNLKSMGAVVMVFALKRKLMPNTYWLNLPADSPDKSKNKIPFLALVEHTNYIEKVHYGGDHLIYCGDYITPDHAYLTMSREDLENKFLSALPLFNPDFQPDWVRKSWLFRTPYAQPVPEINHSQILPDLRTPIPHLYFASMSQVYPWDRGTNYAVEIGRKTADLIVQDSKSW